MKTNHFLPFLAFFAALFTFFACSSDPEPSPTPPNEPSSDSSGEVAKLCGNIEYDASIYRCESGELIGKCKGVDFYPAYQVCNNGAIESKNPSTPTQSSSSIKGSSSSISPSSGVSSSSVLSSPSSQSSSSKITCEDNDLGKGYDVIRSAYINKDQVKPNPILDQDKLCQAGIIKTNVSNSDQDFSLSTGKSIKTLYEARNTKIGVGASFFAGGIEGKFSTGKAETSTSQVYYAQLRSYNYLSNDEINTNKQNLSQYLTIEFASDLKSNKTADQIFKDYGTHVFIRYKKGGYLEANYTYYGTSLASESDVEVAIKGHYGVVSGSASSSETTKELTSGSNTSFNYKTYGGTQLSATTFDALTNNGFKTWINSLNTTPALRMISGIGDFDNSLVPIWDLARAAGYTDEATALQNAFNKLAVEQGVAFPPGRMFEEMKVPIKSSTNTQPGINLVGAPYSISACQECTIVEAEIYATGGGGGGQGGDSTYTTDGILCTGSSPCLNGVGTGAGGGGGATTYARLGGLNLEKGKPIIFDSLFIGGGGFGMSNILPNLQKKGEYSGTPGQPGKETRVLYKGTRIIANGGSGGGGAGSNTTGGAGGLASSLPTNSTYYIAGSGRSEPGKKGKDGSWNSNIESTGGNAAEINYGTISPFGGGIGGRRSTSNGITLPESGSAGGNGGGGGPGGYSNKSGTTGGNGSLTIVLKYYRSEDKAGATSSSNNVSTQTQPASLLWDLSMGMGLSTGGGWYGYDDQAANDGYSTVVFRDKKDNQYRPAYDVMEWDGGVSFSLDPDGFEYAYSGTGFAWLDGGAAAPSVWGSHTGLCLEYSLSGGGDYYLKIATNGYTEDNEFKISIPKQASVAKRLFVLNNFEQGAGWGTARTLAQAKQNSVGMQIQGEAPRKTIDNPNGYTTTQTGALILKSINWDSCN
ncbi:hypothetical protein R83H12_00386 [Fibrobacteria bacterium R8-3-H12]